ncbi:glycosyltransferase family 1 protein, partial [bacterium]|nr:glycosyltransferase family 1 protein [bacterium]
MFEAWQDHVPVTCSNVTSLPEQAADAALIFDPLSVDSIAAALTRMTTEPELREQLIVRGQKRLQDFSWDRTARAYRAVYRRAAGVNLTKEDHHLLNWDWMKKD